MPMTIRLFSNTFLLSTLQNDRTHILEIVLTSHFGHSYIYRSTSLANETPHSERVLVVERFLRNRLPRITTVSTKSILAKLNIPKLVHIYGFSPIQSTDKRRKPLCPAQETPADRDLDGTASTNVLLSENNGAL